MPKTVEGPSVGIGGLVTVAFLKASLDEGRDHLGIFQTLVTDVLGEFKMLSFTTADVQGTVAAVHGVAMPQDAVVTILKRLARKGIVEREAGRYRRSEKPISPASSVKAEKKLLEAGQERLGEALRAHAARRGLALTSTEAALDMLLRFVRDEHVALLLGGGWRNGSGPGATGREKAITAEFIYDALRDDEALLGVLRGVVEGLVLYQAAFLPELQVARRDFRDLQVIFDSVLVRQALGYEGSGMQALVRETLQLLKESGADCIVLDKTILEIKRILSMYEDRLATAEGRNSLRTVPMARHFLTQRYSTSDVREMSALLETEIAAVGFEKRSAPAHVREYTAGEKALAARLADPATRNEVEPRVLHDVDCVAAVLTMRKGHRSATIEESGAVFATSAPLVIRNTRAWWEEDEHETGMAPIVHIRALSNLAWLKKPALCADYKLRELIALCGAAMRPSPETWKRFLRHLEELRTSNRLTSDEVTAVVVSAMSDRLLREAEMEEEDPADIDAATLDEVVERVKAAYAEAADEKARGLERQYEQRLSEFDARLRKAESRAEVLEKTVAEEQRKTGIWVDGQAASRARAVARLGQTLLALLGVGGAAVLIAGHEYSGGVLGVIAGTLLGLFVALELFGVFRHVRELRRKWESCLCKWFRSRLVRKLHISEDEDGRTE